MTAFQQTKDSGFAIPVTRRKSYSCMHFDLLTINILVSNEFDGVKMNDIYKAYKTKQCYFSCASIALLNFL